MKTYDDQGRLLEKMTGVSSDLSDFPANVGDGFLKRTTGNGAWEEVGYGTGANTVCQGNDSRVVAALPNTSAQLLAAVDVDARILRSRLANVGTTFLLGNDTGYFVYVGRTAVSLTPLRVEGWITNIGVGPGPVGEFGIFSTPSGPTRGTQTLTKLVAGSAADMRNVGISRNSSAFGTVIAAGTHLWAAVRSNLATTQPTYSGLCCDFDDRTILMAGAIGLLTSVTSVTGSPLAQNATMTTALAPDLRITLD